MDAWLHRTKGVRGENESNSRNEGNTALQLSGRHVLEDLHALFQRSLLDLWLHLAGSDSAQYLLELRLGAPGAHLDSDVLHGDGDERERDLADRKTDYLDETTDPDSME